MIALPFFALIGIVMRRESRPAFFAVIFAELCGLAYVVLAVRLLRHLSSDAADCPHSLARLDVALRRLARLDRLVQLRHAHGPHRHDGVLYQSPRQLRSRSERRVYVLDRHRSD